MNEWTSRFISALEALKGIILKFDEKDLLPGVVVVAQTLFQLLQLTTEVISDRRYSLESIRLCLTCGSAGDKVVVTWDDFINEFIGRFDAEAGVFNDGTVKFPSVTEHLEYVTKNIDDRIRSLSESVTRGSEVRSLSPGGASSNCVLKQEAVEEPRTRSSMDASSDTSRNDSESGAITAQEENQSPVNRDESKLCPQQTAEQRSIWKREYEQSSRIDPNAFFGNSFDAQLHAGQCEAERGHDVGAVSFRCFLCKIPDAVYNSFEFLAHHIITDHATADHNGRVVILCPKYSAGCTWSEPVASCSGSVLEQIINHILIEHKISVVDFVSCYQADDVDYYDRCFSQYDDQNAPLLKPKVKAQFSSRDYNAVSETRALGLFQTVCADDELKAASVCCKVQGCGQKFGAKAFLKQHVESVHRIKAKFTCSHCRKSFLQKSKYCRHIIGHHSDRIALQGCEICSPDISKHQLYAKLFNDAVKSNDTTSEINRCGDDSKTTIRVSGEVMSMPSDVHVGQLSFPQDDFCHDEETLDTSDDKSHILNRSGGSVGSVKKTKLAGEEVDFNKGNCNTLHFTRYQCFLCVSSADVFETSSALFTHVRNIHVQSDGTTSTIECPYCTETKVVQKGVGSYILSQVLSHMVKKHRIGIPDYVKPFYCPEPNCNFLSIRRYELNTHAQKHLTADIKVPCEKCGKFMQQRSLGLHAKFCSASTIDREMFKCTVCGKVISTKQGLQKHFQNKHENRKDFLCSHCTKAFSGKGELEDHAFRRHGVNISNKPVFSCVQCAFKTILSFSLKRHISEAHSTTKHHQCLVCNKFFKSPMQLKSHKVAHEERTHHCSMCDYAAARKSNLDAHVKAQHSGVQYKCEKCGYQTGYYANLCKHQRTVCGHQNK